MRNEYSKEEVWLHIIVMRKTTDNNLADKVKEFISSANILALSNLSALFPCKIFQVTKPEQNVIIPVLVLLPAASRSNIFDL